jgi:hypothetical protein
MSAKKVPFASDGIDLGCFEAVIHDGQQWVDQRHMIECDSEEFWSKGGIGIRPLLSYKCRHLCGIATRSRQDSR